MGSNLVLGLGIAAVGVAAAVGFNIIARKLQARIEAARSWTAVPAVIQSARLTKAGKTNFAPKITYSYSVGGTSYTGNRLQFGGVTLTRMEAQEILDAYPVGSTTEVRYDPGRHDFAVLRLAADIKSFKVASIFIGLSFFITGLVVAFAT